MNTHDTGSTTVTKAMLESAATFASTDITRPILNAVRFDNGTLLATDSYRAIRITASETFLNADCTPHQRTVSLASVKAAAKAAPKADTALTLAPNGYMLASGLDISLESVEGAYPPVADLFPTDEPLARVSLDPRFLADLATAAKKLGGRAHVAVTLSLYGEDKAVGFEIKAGHETVADGLIMPVRM